MRCCAYLRKSREDEERERLGRFETLARHKRQLESLATGNGHVIEQWYKETVSGETVAARPQMVELLKSIAHGQWDAVYVMEAARLGRGGGSDQERILNCLRYTGTHLITPDKEYDPESPGDMRLLKKELQSSEDELDTITTRLTRGKYQAAREGIYQASGRPPYGWRCVRDGLDWTLEPDENHHHMLRIYDLLEQGEGWATIAKTFNREGVPRSKGGRTWTPSAVQAIARNPVNCGYVTYAKRVVRREFDPETFQVVKRHVKNPNPIVAKGKHFGRGGIAPERFERIVGERVEMARLHADHELKNPLATLLRCGLCGRSMLRATAGTKERRVYYFRHPKDTECPGCRAANCKAVETAFLEELTALIGDLRVEASGNAEAAYIARKSGLQADAAAARAKLARVMDAYEAGAYSLEDMRERKAEAQRAIDAAESALLALAPPRPARQIAESLGECVSLMASDAAPQQVNDFLRGVIDRIDYYNDTPPLIHDNRFRLDVFLR